MPKSKSTSALAKEIRTLRSDARSAVFRVVDLVAEGRIYFDNSLQWIEWCKLKVGISRRFAFICLRVFRFTDILKAADTSDLVPILELHDITRVEILAALETPERVSDFLDFHDTDISEFNRKELRHAVNEFLGR